MTTTQQAPVGLAVPTLRRARERFLAGRPLPDGVPDEVVAAWRRARFFGVPRDLRETPAGPPPREPSALLAAARPVLERIAPALDGDGTLLLLTDERLRVLWSAGNLDGEEACADLSERAVGHNSAALALRTRRRGEVHGPEHFLDRWQEVSAVSVPVLAPDGAQALGTLTVATRMRAGCRPHPQAALVEGATAAVEAELLARAGQTERVLLDAYLRATRTPDGAVVAVLDGRNRLISAEAERVLTPEVLQALERTAVAARRGNETAEPVLPDTAACTARITQVRQDGAVVGIVAALRPLREPVRAIMPSAGLTLTGSSVAWRYAVGRAVELARTPEPLLLTGERGTGKTTLARELLAGHAVRIVDAAERVELGCPPADLVDGRALLIRHAERMAQPAVAALNSLLDTHPHMWLLVTYTPGTQPGPCLQRLLDQLGARSVTLPALRERAEDIRQLLRALTPRSAPGRPPLTWTLDALRALERYPWPGNVTELGRVVKALAEDRRVTGPVRRSELPEAVREGPAPRQLSPMEHAERVTILEALHRHGGNKTRAAAALGIGRATLYRKLRGYLG
ncbi:MULTISPECIES: helix-turn-helix domain-containing protein [Streptomyces]|uniref:helix-turn-helix domain-containing protein n=1 Tax=Streptomyces TaxID=1883 RepID=UPI0006AF15F9|nr:helix-turn-helix domain-containing protein [Streptomyces sp. AS58]